MLIVLAVFTSCDAQKISANNRNDTAMKQKFKYQTTEVPKYYCGIPDVSDTYLRPVLIGEKLFGYRAYDYQGGFYICTQIAVANKEEIQQKVEFDRIKEQYVYLMRYVPQGIYEAGKIRQYRMYCLRLPSLESLDTIDFETIANNPDWKWAPDIITPSMPDYLVLWNQLDAQEQVKAVKQEERTPNTPKWAAKQQESLEKESQFDVMRLIRELKAKKQYDTIVKTDHSTLYVNTDYLCYEIPDDPEVFYVTKREYHPNGVPKLRSYFFAGVHENESVPFGPVTAWDEKGEITYNDTLNPAFFSFDMDYYLKWMAERNYIDPKTGKGKPTMKINTYVNLNEPSYGVPRVKIETNWQFQVSEGFGTVAILIKEADGTETVFIFANGSKIILDKFNR